MARPLTKTEEKRNVVMPPITGSGIATMAAANLAKMPAIIKKRLKKKKERKKEKGQQNV